MTRHIPYLLVAFFALAFTFQSQAQSESNTDEDRAFKTFRTSLSVSSVIKQRGLNSWTPAPAARLSFSTPYHRGHFEMELGWRRWTVQEVILPEFQAFTVLAGWSAQTPPDFAIELHAGIMVGNVLMLLDLENADAGRIESEITAIPFVRFNRNITPALRLFVQLRAARVFTNPRWEFVDSSVGLSVDQKTPSWLKRILR